VHRLQKHQLFHHTQQEKGEGKTGNEKALPRLPEAYFTQGSEIIQL
jgi:hypothetical protein